MSDNSVSDNSIINDIRTSSDFKSITFSGYKKTDVKNQLIENILKGKIEPACHWCAELLCSGNFIDIWECVLFYFYIRMLTTIHITIFFIKCINYFLL